MEAHPSRQLRPLTTPRWACSRCETVSTEKLPPLPRSPGPVIGSFESAGRLRSDRDPARSGVGQIPYVAGVEDTDGLKAQDLSFIVRTRVIAGDYKPSHHLTVQNPASRLILLDFRPFGDRLRWV